MLEFARADIREVTGQETGFISKLGVVLFHPGLHAVLLYRLSRWFHVHRMHPLAVLVGYVSSVLTGAQISPRAMIDKALVIYHPHGVVVGSTAVIGSHCTLVHGNVIGQLYGGGDRPVIGDHFYAGTGAKILGSVQIGNHVRVGANAVVVQSLPDGATVGIQPARILPGFGSGAGADASIGSRGGSADSRDAILRRLVSLLPTTLKAATVPDAIGEDTELLGAGIGLDSIEVLGLISAMEEEFQLTIDESELKESHFKTVGSLVTLIQERLGA